MNTESMYTALGITPAVHRFGEEILAGLRARFDEIDRVAEYNQCKVIGAMQKKIASTRRTSPPPRATATTMPGATISSASMLTASTPRPRSCARRSPAARTR